MRSTWPRRCGADRLATRATRLAASGLTNREIAQQLFVTLKTVEMHVGNALTKAGVASRHELTACLAAADDPDREVAVDDA